MTRFKLLFFLLLTTLAIGCGGETNINNQNAGAGVNTASNRTDNNAMVVTNPGNENNQLTAPTIEVPTYENANAALEAGKKFFESNEDEKAVKALEQSVQLDPNLPEAQFQLALAYDAVDNQENAEKAYSAAIKAYLSYLQKNPKDAAAQLNLGRSYGKLNEDEKAQKAIQQAVKLKPDDGEYHYELGTILIKLAKYSEAIRELKRSLELDPENTRAEAALEKAESGNDRVAASQIKSKENKSGLTKGSATNTSQNKNINAPPESGGSDSNVKKTANVNSAP